MPSGYSIALLLSCGSLAASEPYSDEISLLQSGAEVQQKWIPRFFRRKQEEQPKGDRNVGVKFVQELHNFQDIEYSGDINIGGQTIRGIYDTGSYELLVMSQKCKAGSCVPKARKKFFDPAKSLSLKEEKWTRDHSFGSGETHSILAKDILEVGPIHIETAPFWEVTNATMDILGDATFQAIVGVSHPNQPAMEISEFVAEDEKLIESSKRKKQLPPTWVVDQKEMDANFLEVVKKANTPLKSLQVTTFSICFLKGKGKPGYFIWNDMPPASLRAGYFSKIAITGKTTWTSPLTRVRLVGGSGDQKTHDSLAAFDLCGGKNDRCAALFDSGTSLMSAPTYAVNKLMQVIQGANLNCNRLGDMPKLEFTINGVVITMPAEEYIGMVTGEPHILAAGAFPQWRKLLRWGNKCTTTMMAMDIPTDDGDLWIVGMPFFRQYYATFNLGEDATYPNMDVERSIFVAQAVENCEHPQTYGKMPRMLNQLEQPEARTVDISKVRIPTRYLEAAKHGGLRL